MTEQTQTTAERLLALIANNQQTIRTGGIQLIDHGRAANLIAAEIDRLTADNAQANQWLVNGVAKIAELEKQLAEARAEVTKLKEQNRILATTSLRDVIKSVHPSGRARGQ